MEIVREHGLTATMPDGVDLVADAWYPAEGGPWPVLLQRLPYGRSVASAPVLPHPVQLARAGYAVISQDVRGRGDSGGELDPFVNEGPDGAATVEWAAGLPFCDGQVAMYGFSYQGVNQLLTAALKPPSLRAIAPMQCAPGPYDGWTYQGGALQWPFVPGWAAQLAGQEPGVAPPPVDPLALPTIGALGVDPPAWYREWLEHPAFDDYWAARTPDLDAIDVPAFVVVGWADSFPASTVALAEALEAETVLGPWGHMPWGSKIGPVELGPEASPAIAHQALLGFFDRVLKGTGDEQTAPVRYFTGGQGWRGARAWPPPAVATVSWVGASATGWANGRHGDGVLGPAQPSRGEAVPTVLAAEPLVPVPGGLDPYSDESATEDRRDVACFTSDELAEDLVLTGSPLVTVHTAADVPTHDVVVSLCRVDQGDRSVRLTTGVRRLRDVPVGEVITTTVPLSPTSVVVPAGSRIRIDVSASRFPAFDRNPQNPAVAVHEAGRDDCVVALIDVLRIDVALPVDHG